MKNVGSAILQGFTRLEEEVVAGEEADEDQHSHGGQDPTAGRPYSSCLALCHGSRKIGRPRPRGGDHVAVPNRSGLRYFIILLERWLVQWAWTYDFHVTVHVPHSAVIIRVLRNCTSEYKRQ